jgi:GNAT superfamily N-acetyltransferase
MRSFVVRIGREDDHDERFPSCPDPTYVLEIDGQKIGHCNCGIIGDSLAIPEIEVLLEFRRRGYGERFVWVLELLAKEASVAKVTAKYVTGKPSVEAFWRSAGFQPIAGDPDDNWIKQL